MLLFLGAVLLFGSRDVFKKKNCFVAYFEQSITGLTVGDPVKFRGVVVGSVAKIDGVYDPKTSIVYPRVILDFHTESLKNADLEVDSDVLFRSLVEKGMRAKLKKVSFVTGQLFVSLDFDPNSPARYLGDGTDDWPEMPTVDSGLSEILSALEGLPLDELIQQITSTLTSIDNVVSSEGIKRSSDYLPTLLETVNSTVGSIGAFTSTDLPQTTGQLRTTLETGDRSMSTLTDKLANETLVTLDDSMTKITNKLTQETLVELSATMKSFDAAMGKLQLTLGTAQSRLDPADPLTYELSNTLREVARASASLKSFTDYLDTHPEALIRGR